MIKKSFFAALTAFAAFALCATSALADEITYIGPQLPITSITANSGGDTVNLTWEDFNGTVGFVLFYREHLESGEWTPVELNDKPIRTVIGGPNV
jgi:hypothetical protein